MKVLLVDDEKSFLEQGKIFLKKEDETFKIDTLPSAEKAVEKLKANGYDAIISDYQMPEMNGLEFLKEIREEKQMDIPFVIFTGKGREEVAIKALNLGADRYIQKGGDPKSQFGVLAQAVKQEIKHYEDAREKKKVEAELSSLVKASEDPIYIVDKDCNILFANRAELDKTGMTFDEITDSKFIESHPKDDTLEFRKKVEEVIKTGEPQTHEVKHEEDKKYYYRTLSPIRNPSTGEIDRIAVISKDITDRRDMEEDLKESEQKYRRLVETTGDLIFIHDERGKVKFVNKAGLEFSGYDEEEVIGKNIMEFIPDSELGTLLERKKRRVEEGDMGRQHFETAFIDKDGERMAVDVQSTPLSERGEFKGELVVARDISDSKERKEKLKKYQKIFEEISDPVMLQDLDGKYILLNEAVSEYAGLAKEELIGKDESEFMDERSYEKINEKKQEVLEKEEQIEYEVTVDHKDKRERYIKTSRFPFYDRDNNLIGTVAICKDITKQKEKEKSRKSIEKKYKTLFDELSDALFLEDEEGNILEVNDEACDLLGYNDEEFMDMKVDDLVPEGEDKLLPGEIDEATLDGKPLKTVNLSKDGTKVPVEVRGKMIEVEGKERLLVSLRDIRERKEVEQDLKRYKLAVEKSEEQIAVIDDNYSYMLVNDAFLEYHELDREDVIGREVKDIVGEKLFKNTIKENVDKCLQGKTLQYTMTRKYPEAGNVHLDVLYYPLKEEDNIQGVVAVIRNITDRKEKEKRLEERIKRDRRLFENLGDAVFVVKVGGENHGEILMANEVATEQTEWKKNELIGKNIHQWIVEGPLEITTEKVAEKLENDESVSITLKRERKDGSTYWSEETIVPFQYDGVDASIVVSRDITERKEMEKELRKTKARMSTLLSTIPSYVYMKDENLNFVTANDALCDMLGVSKEEIKGKDDYDFFPEEDADSYQSDDRKVVETGESVRNRIEKVPVGDGNITWNLTNKRPIKDDEGNVIGLVGQTLDITERIEAEEELRKREKELRTVTSGTRDAIIMIDSKDRVQFWNEGAEDMFGYTEEEAKEKKAHDLIAPDKYLEKYETGFDKFRETGEGKVLDDTIEVDAKRKDGTSFPIELSVSSLKKDDELIAVAVIRDITERKEAEEREEFLHSLLRHDVANKNRVVHGYLELLKEYDLSEEVVDIVENSEVAIEKSIKLIEKVRILREAQNEEIEELDISTIIKNNVSQIRPMVKEAGMKIEKECPEDPCMVKGGPLIDNVFSNIIENSVKHSDGSKLMIHTEVTQDEVICIFEDDGKGIPEEDEDNIFEKGYTTDEERGTGLGLFLVQMLLDIYDGKIEIGKSELGGARFDIHLKRK